jgi:acyl-coenzyme A thioesterase PaaI-like protein
MNDLPIVNGGPEATFRVEGITIDRLTTRASMPVGEWLRDADGRLGPGALGVFADDVLGYAIISARPSDEVWSVSTEITLDVFPALQHPTAAFHGEAQAVEFDEHGCFSTARFTNDRGELVALGSQRGRFVPLPTGIDRSDGTATIGASLDELVGATVDGGVLALSVTGPVQNPLGNLHGGISLCASDLAAAAALSPLRTTSIRIVYLRPSAGGSVVEYTATAAHRGRSFGLVDIAGRVNGKLVTKAQVTAGPA